jgi:hypothetical protein
MMYRHRILAGLCVLVLALTCACATFREESESERKWEEQGHSAVPSPHTTTGDQTNAADRGTTTAP